MEKRSAGQALEDAQRFVAQQRAMRDDQSPTYRRDGSSHVIVGEVRPLSPDFRASHELLEDV